MSWWNDVGAWFTGRNGVYRDSDKVDQALEDLTSISDKIDDYLDTPLRSAIVDLNAVTGFNEYVGTLNQGAFDDLTAEANTGIEAMIAQIKAKKEDIDEYDKGSFLEHLGGTASMVVGKVGEGFISVFEGIGDAALTVGNWVGSGVVALATGEKYTDVLNSENNFMKKAIEYDVAGTLMSPLTENEWASKYSAITKDSGAASICKGVGKAIGYVTIAGYVSGACQAVNAASTGAKAASILANTTNANALVAGISGFGQGTQTGLQSGKSFEASTGQGAIQGLVEGGTAYAVGKIGEQARIGKVNKTLDAKAADQGWTDDFLEAQKAAAKTNIRAQGGYNDSMTRTMQAKGRSDMNAVISAKAEAAANGAGKLGQAGAVIKQGAKNQFNNTVVTPVKKVMEIPGAVKQNFTDDTLINQGRNFVNRKAIEDGTKTAVHGGTKLGKAASGVVRTALEPEKHILNAVAATATTLGGTASVGGVTRMATEAALGGTTNAIDRATGLGSNSDIAAAQFQSRQKTEEALNPKPSKLEDWKTAGSDDTPSDDTPSDTNTPTDTNTTTNTPTETNKTTPTETTGSSGGSSVGNTGGGGTTSSDAQFRESDKDKTDTNKSSNNAASNNPTPNSAANIVFHNNSASNTPTPNASANNGTQSNTTTPAQEPGQDIVTPADPGTNPDNPTPGASVPTGGGTTHTGGGYTGDSGYVTDGVPENTESIVGTEGVLDEELDEAADSIDSIISGGSNFTKLPTSNSAVASGSSSGSAVIPVVAGLSAAAAAGIGAKAYMDRKNNNDNGEDDFEAEEWTGEDDLDIDYDDGVQEEQYLDDESDLGTEESSVKYDARSNDELADLQ